MGDDVTGYEDLDNAQFSHKYHNGILDEMSNGQGPRLNFG